jgi:PKD repeat protein
MKNKGVYFIVCALFLSFLISVAIADASFVYKSNTLKQSYSSGEQITGSISITLRNQSYNSLITSNVNGEITLGELLKKNGFREGIEYTCSNPDCSTDFSAKNPVSSIEIDRAIPATVGFKVTGTNSFVKDISLKINSDSAPGCRKQLLISMFDDQNYYLQNPSYNVAACGAMKTGCFDSTLSDNKYTKVHLGTKEYCIQQKLPSAPAYQLGAVIYSPVSNPAENLTMRLYSADFSTMFGRCELDVSGLSDEINSLSCVTEFGSNVEREYYICVSSGKETSEYQIRTEETSPTCGAYSLNPANIGADFEINAQPLEYATPDFVLDSYLFNKTYYTSSFTAATNAFLRNRYNNDCRQNECIIPITLSGDEQALILDSPLLTYLRDGISTVTDNNLYNVTLDDALVDAQDITLILNSAQFSIPYGTKPLYLNLYLDSKLVVRVPINVTIGPLIDVNPKFAFIGISTQFSVTSSSNLASALWNFGDGSASAQGIGVSHKYSQAGTYNLIVEATTSNGQKSSRSLQLVVGEPKASAEELLRLNRIKMININSNIASAPSWIQSTLKEQVDIQAINKTLSEIETGLKSAKTNDDYILLINGMQNLDLPFTLGFSSQLESPLSILYSHIDTSILETLSEREVMDSGQLRKELVNWLDDNYNAKMVLKDFTGKYDSGEQSILSTVSISLTPKKTITDEQYFIIDYPLDALKFKQNYGQKEANSATYIPLTNDIREIEFAIPGGTALDSLDVYLAPNIAALEKEIIEPVKNSQLSRIIFMVAGFIVLILLVLLAAFGLQYWYKQRYERYLFKKSDDLYNVMTFIYNSRNSGLESREIKKKLEDTGWRGEQINYAYDKLNGRVLGIFGIPIFRAAQERKVTTEIQRRQQINSSATFIKRPSF